MPDDAAIDIDLTRRARAAYRAGDLEAAKRFAAQLWLRYENQAVLASRRVARGAERDDVLGCIGIRFTKWIYHRDEDPRNMVGLINQICDQIHRGLVFVIDQQGQPDIYGGQELAEVVMQLQCQIASLAFFDQR